MCRMGRLLYNLKLLLLMEPVFILKCTLNLGILHLDLQVHRPYCIAMSKFYYMIEYGHDLFSIIMTMITHTLFFQCSHTL